MWAGYRLHLCALLRQCCSLHVPVPHPWHRCQCADGLWRTNTGSLGPSLRLYVLLTTFSLQFRPRVIRAGPEVTPIRACFVCFFLLLTTSSQCFLYAAAVVALPQVLPCESMNRSFPFTACTYGHDGVLTFHLLHFQCLLRSPHVVFISYNNREATIKPEVFALLSTHWRVSGDSLRY
jgi:hypothetical protein